jgi:hypothetical protein
VRNAGPFYSCLVQQRLALLSFTGTGIALTGTARTGMGTGTGPWPPAPSTIPAQPAATRAMILPMDDGWPSARHARSLSPIPKQAGKPASIPNGTSCTSSVSSIVPYDYAMRLRGQCLSATHTVTEARRSR